MSQTSFTVPFFDTTAHVFVTDENRVQINVEENQPATVNKIPVYLRAYAKRRTHSASFWLENLFTYRATGDRWTQPDVTDNQRSKLYSALIEIIEDIPAGVFLLAQTEELGREIERKAKEIEKAENELAKLKETHRSMTASYEAAVLDRAPV